MKPILYAAILVIAGNLIAQNPETYVNSREETHLCGPVSITDLMNHGDWYQEQALGPCASVQCLEEQWSAGL